MHINSIKASRQFKQWIENNPSYIANHYKNDSHRALLGFLTDAKGFALIKNYEQLCELWRIAKIDYAMGNNPPSKQQFGKAVLQAHPETFRNSDYSQGTCPILPEEVKLSLLGEKFHQWMQGHKNKAEHTSEFYHSDQLLKFLFTYGILEQVQDHKTYGALANVIHKSYSYNTNQYIINELSFYRKVQESTSRYYFGAEPIVIPENIAREIEEENRSEAIHMTAKKYIADVVRQAAKAATVRVSGSFFDKQAARQSPRDIRGGINEVSPKTQHLKVF